LVGLRLLSASMSLDLVLDPLLTDMQLITSADIAALVLQSPLDDDDLDENELAAAAATLPTGASPGKRQRIGTNKAKNPCKECDIQHKYSVPGHTKYGWCPVRQCFSLRANEDKGSTKSAGARLRDLLHDQELKQQGDYFDFAREFVAAVRASSHTRVKELLNGKKSGKLWLSKPMHELILIKIPSAPRGRESRMWNWSALSEAVRLVPAEASMQDSAFRTFNALLSFANQMRLDLDHSMMRKSDTNATVLHQAVCSGNLEAIRILVAYTLVRIIDCPSLVQTYNGKLGLWAETRSNWMPIHLAFVRRQPAYAQRATLVPWLLMLMDQQLDAMKEAMGGGASTSESLQLPDNARAALSTKRPGKERAGPQGFHDRDGHDCDIELFEQEIAMP